MEEDELDWGDSSTGPPTPQQEQLHSRLFGDMTGFAQEADPLFGGSSHEHSETPSGQPYNPYSNEAAQLKPAITRAERSKIGVHLNRRKPSKEDYSNFVLYHGNQKVYEMTFLEYFLEHALHPDQVNACLPTSSDDREVVHRYFRSISNNVKQLLRKMVYNTHSRIVKFMANDDKETTPFWDHQQFDDRIFADFSPGNTAPIVGMMHNSWHKAFRHPSMVRFTPDQYEVGVNISPFEEIDDVTGETKLFEDRNTAHATFHDRVVHPPRTKKPKNHHLPSASIRGHTSVPRDHWLQGLGGYGIGESSKDAQKETRRLPFVSYDNPLDVMFAESDAHHDGNPPKDYTFNTLDGIESPGAQGVVEPPGNDTTLRRVSESHPQAEEPTGLEALVQKYGSDVLLQQSGPSSLREDALRVAKSTMRPLWRSRLIEDHKRRLAERWPQSQQRREALLSFEAYVDRALAQGDLKRLVPSLRRIVGRIDPPTLASQPESAQHTRNNTGQTILPEQSIDLNPVRQLETLGLPPPKTSSKRPQDILNTTTHTRTSSDDRPKKRQKATPKTSKTPRSIKGKGKQSVGVGYPPIAVSSSTTSNPGPSKTLETHQQLPPDAYFEKKTEDEELAWRCGISHCMGHYYNAGDRKNCAGCFTSVREDVNPKRKIMDFYLPSRSHFFQPAPDAPWKCSKPTVKQRKSTNMSHNSIAKDVYWEAINNGASKGEAWKKGIEAVEEHLRAKVEKKEKKKKEPTPEPTPKPIDLGPHPSGSITMEHGQALPIGAYWKKSPLNRYEEEAWRCDVNHALGRYYMAGDIKSCHGCGSCKNGQGRNAKMDFFLPAGTVARQKAPDLVKWKPRPAYKLSKKSKKAKQCTTHNQLASKNYWELVDQGHKHVEGSYDADTLALAIKATEDQIDAKMEAVRAKFEDMASSGDEEVPKLKPKTKGKRKQKEQLEVSSKEPSPRRGRSGAQLIPLAPSPSRVPRKRHSEELDLSEFDEVSEYESGKETEPQPETIPISSDDESSSSSDSE
ncbi:hypothetical protein BU23DRAFT_225144 [Bimuria novae-zelandiae CBS 107.79]|uniref:Uncharacterized protein n=1 Tax=Bimuria novae-zelandiae CBS 107.79 TaxID=1447943 RepID=A0A6A5VMD0_9PLEO|nr:hypothetical protein BU23DRAFT_225144 [Bimuria novae-zelandiae CBS 107.79]